MRRFLALGALLTLAMTSISTLSLAGSWNGMITDAGSNPAYRASTVNEPWTECGPRLWHRSLAINMTADQVVKKQGYGLGCGYDGFRGGTDRGSDGTSPGL